MVALGDDDHRRVRQRRRRSCGGDRGRARPWASRSWELPLYDDYRRADRLARRRHQEHRRALRRRDHRGVVPGGVRGRHAVGAPGHRRPRVRRSCARPRTAGRAPASRCGRSSGSCRTARRPRDQGGRRHRGPHEPTPVAHGAGPRRLRASRRRRDLRGRRASRSGRAPAARCTCWCSRTATVARSDPAQDRAELARDPRGPRPRPPAACWASRACRSWAIHDGELENTRGRARGRDPPDPRGARRDASCRSIPPRCSSRTATTTTPTTAPPAMIALDSAFPGSGNPHFFSEHLGEGLEVQEVHDVWLGWTNEPNHIEDVSEPLRARRSMRSPSTRASSPRASRSSRSSWAEDAVRGRREDRASPTRRSSASSICR